MRRDMRFGAAIEGRGGGSNARVGKRFSVTPVVLLRESIINTNHKVV